MGYPLPPQQICRTVPQQSLMSLSQCLSWRRAGLSAGAEHAVSSHSFPEILLKCVLYGCLSSLMFKLCSSFIWHCSRFAPQV